MLDKFWLVIRRAISGYERDRLDQKFDRVDEKLDNFDTRLDNLEKSYASSYEKLSAIHQVTLANNEALEAKINRSTVSSETVREIVDVRLAVFQESLKRLESLISQVLNRDCNLR